MKWTNEYSTGIERLDDQHKTIFKTAEDFRIALDEGAGERTYGLLLEFLERYCRSHFHCEERCMEEYHCRVAARNKEAHAKFVEVLSEFRHRYAAGGYDRADARKLVDRLDQWLAEHICSIDVHLRECVEKRP